MDNNDNGRTLPCSIAIASSRGDFWSRGVGSVEGEDSEDGDLQLGSIFDINTW